MGGVVQVEGSPTSSKRAKSHSTLEGGTVCALCNGVVSIRMTKSIHVQECELDFLCLTCSGGGIGARRFSN